MTAVSLRQRPARAICAFIGLVLFAASGARAQDYPNRTVTIVAPSAPGGMYSILARLIGSKLERLYGQSFVIENRPGASSIAGAVFVAHAAPDGYTLMTAASTTMATNVSLHRSLPYDPLTDFIPIVQIARSPEVLLINATLPVRSIGDLVKLARSTPGGLSFGSAGPGTGQHLNGELLKMRLGIPMQHIPYKGMQPALNDLAGGHIAMMTSPIPLALPLADGGKVRMLGVTTKERVGAIPDVPPLAEIGVPGYDAASWWMLVAPAKTPRSIVDKLHDNLRVVLRETGCPRRVHPAPGTDSGRFARARRITEICGSRDRPPGRHRAQGRPRRERVTAAVSVRRALRPPSRWPARALRATARDPQRSRHPRVPAAAASSNANRGRPIRAQSLPSSRRA
jgi:tripartite-type tricarboxylate transporter receptor subunit TctC